MTKFDSRLSRNEALKSGRIHQYDILHANVFAGQDSIFEDYLIQSATHGNTINLQVSLTHLNRALRSAVAATSASLRLTKKDDIPILSLTILTTTFTPFRPAALENVSEQRFPAETPNPINPTEGDRPNEDSISLPNQATAPFSHDRETTITQSIPVTVLAPQSVASIHEPTCREPDVHICLPPLLQLKAISERFTRLALPISTTATNENKNTRLILSASPFGEFRIGVETAVCKIESKWQDLTNPELDASQVEGGEEGLREHASTKLKERVREEAWATVRVDARDWGRVLGVGRLGGRVIASSEPTLAVSGSCVVTISKRVTATQSAKVLHVRLPNVRSIFIVNPSWE
ncbi:MAG: hypothetical protein Q9186_005675 [Xanthomendoza sp. 1 TL-2023]